MNLGLWPDAVPFDPRNGSASEAMKSQLGSASLPDALLLVGGTEAGPWIGQAALAVARTLCASGRRVLLVDLQLEEPALHEALALPNVEGIADVLMFGASLERVIQRPPGEPFDFIATGALAPHPAEILDHPAWSRILAEVRSGGTTLLGLARGDAPGIEAMAERMGAIIVLAESDLVAPIVARLPEPVTVHGVIRLADATREPAALASGLAAPTAPVAALSAAHPEMASGDAMSRPAAMTAATDDPVAALMIADLERRQRASLGERGPRPRPTPAARSPVIAPPRAAAGRPTAGRSWAIGLVLMALVIVAGYLLATRVMRSGPADDPGPAAGPRSPGGPGRAGPVSFSVVMESREDLASALALADSLTVAESGLQFYIAPVRVDGVMFYRVLAGPMADSASAAAVLQSLVDRGLKVAATAWDVRSTPLAFAVDGFDDRIEAEFRVAELRELGVPSYIVEVPRADTPAIHVVYAGAYSAPSEAEPMRALLRSRALPDTLVVRMGRVRS